MEDAPDDAQPMVEDSEMPDVGAAQAQAGPDHAAASPAPAAMQISTASLSDEGSQPQPPTVGPQPWPLPPHARLDASSVAASPPTQQEEAETGTSVQARKNDAQATEAETAMVQAVAPRTSKAPANLVTSWGPSAPARRIIAASLAPIAAPSSAPVPPTGMAAASAALPSNLDA